MADAERTERDDLRGAVSVLRDWRLDKVPNEVESVFSALEDLDQSRNLDLWQQLRATLATNEALRHLELLKYTRDEERAAAGYWWYHPANGRQPSEADA